jgi:hypothetical protein
MTPRWFVEQLERLAATRPAAEVLAFYDRYGPAAQPLLRGNDRSSVAAIMEVADTVVEYEAAAHADGTATAASKRQPWPEAAAPTTRHCS